MKKNLDNPTDPPERDGDLVGRLLAEQQQQTLRFHTAINNMPQGLCFFDGDHRLIVCNDAYAEMYKLTSDLVKPGTPLTDIVEKRFQSGCFPDMTPEEYMVWRESIAVSTVVSDTVVVLRDGRTIAVHHQPMPDGGWVSTHDDISKRIAIEQALQLANEQLVQLAMYDSLTGLANRRKFAEHFDYEMARVGRAHAPPSVLMVDIDYFKAINDRHGHAAGDECLKWLARTLSETVRQLDVAARFGGDEFVVLLPETSVAQSLLAAERIRRKAEACAIPVAGSASPLKITISVGAATAAGSSSLDEVLGRADKAVYRAKRAGRNRACD